MSALSVAEVLSKAADLIEPEGKWTQGAFWRDRDGKASGMNHVGGIGRPYSRCLVCAVSQAAVADCTPFLKAIGFETYSSAVRWNDATGRTQAEVVAKLRQPVVAAPRGFM